jgi:hypothetical protein
MAMRFAHFLAMLLLGAALVSQQVSEKPGTVKENPPASHAMPQGRAKSPPSPSELIKEASRQAGAANTSLATLAESNILDQTQCDNVDLETKPACLEMWNGFYRAAAEQYANNYRVYLWQLVASWTLLAAMIILMGIGLWIALSQFYLSFRLATLLIDRHPAAKEGDAESATLAGLKELLYSNFEVSKGGLKLSSPIVGIIVLCLSMVFLWVFAKEIYPIVQK